MRRRLIFIAYVAFLIAYAVVLVEFVGFGRRGGWQFALDVGIVAVGVMSLRDWWNKRRKAGG